MTLMYGRRFRRRGPKRGMRREYNRGHGGRLVVVVVVENVVKIQRFS